MQLTNRKFFLLFFLVSLFAWAVALYFQFMQDLSPCMLCVLQRVAFSLIGVFAIIAVLHNPKSWGYRIYSVLILLATCLGLYAAVRQVWLQHLPASQVSACGPGFNYLLKVLPWDKILVMMFEGTKDCAVTHWQFLGLSIAGWSGILLAILLLLAICQLLRKQGTSL